MTKMMLWDLRSAVSPSRTPGRSGGKDSSSERNVASRCVASSSAIAWPVTELFQARRAAPSADRPVSVNVSAFARDRKSVVWGTGVSVRVDLGGRRELKNKKKYTNKTKAE